MSTTVDNTLQLVTVYHDAGLQSLRVSSPGISTTNKNMLNFQNFPASLGTSINYQKPYRGNAVNNLVWQPQGTQQLFETLVVDQQISYSVDFNLSQMQYNVDQFMRQIGRGAVATIATKVETNILLNAISAVVNNDNYNPNNGLIGKKNTRSGPYRFFGDGVTPINSYQQLADMLARFKAFGYAMGNLKGFLYDLAVPAIIQSGLSQFVIQRNEKNYQSWMVMDWQGVNWYQSSLLPIQRAGTCGNEHLTLTVVSVDDPTGNYVTQITFSGAPVNQTKAVASGDLGAFNSLYFNTYYGNENTALLAQIMSTSDVDSDGSGNVVVNIKPGLTWQNSPSNQSAIGVDKPIVPGMTFEFIGDHKAGFLVSGEAFYLGMPKMMAMPPYSYENQTDDVNPISFRMTAGSVLGQNQYLTGWDAIWGSFMDPDYCMRICFPINQ